MLFMYVLYIYFLLNGPITGKGGLSGAPSITVLHRCVMIIKFMEAHCICAYLFPQYFVLWYHMVSPYCFIVELGGSLIQ